MSEVKNKELCAAIKRMMQNCMRKLVSVLPQLEEVETHSKEEVASMANLLEQKHSVTTAKPEEISLMCQFPDLKGRLNVKLSEEIHAKAEVLKTLIDPYREHHSAVDKARSLVIDYCRKHSNELDTSAMIQGQPTIPPYSTMLMWMTEAEKQLREIYHMRVYYLEHLLDSEYSHFDDLQEAWTEEVPKLLDLLKDCEEQTRLFLKEEID